MGNNSNERNTNSRPSGARSGQGRPSQGRPGQGSSASGRSTSGRPASGRPQPSRNGSGKGTSSNNRYDDKRRTTSSSNKKKRKKKNKGLKAILIICWIIFLLLLLGFGAIFLHNNGIVNIPLVDKLMHKNATETDANIDGDYTGEDNTEKIVTRYEYETNANLDINALVTDYFNALANCDKEKLQSLVVDPSQFDDMSVYETKATIITGYNNTNCYTIKGYTDNDTICYALSNITISGISSTPLDIVRFYIVYKDGSYLIDNTKKSTEVAAYIDEINSSSDIQGLYKLVKEDITKCQQEDAQFYEFYQKLMN